MVSVTDPHGRIITYRVTSVSPTIIGQTASIVSDRVFHARDQHGAYRHIRFPVTRSRQEYTDLDG